MSTQVLRGRIEPLALVDVLAYLGRTQESGILNATKGNIRKSIVINEGDIVVIEEGATADNGDIVVALVEGHEATLKRFRKKGNMIALEAANPAYQTRMLRDDQVKVQGKLVGLIRSY